MSTIGNPIKYQSNPYFEGVGDGTTTSYVLGWNPGTAASVIISVGGVTQPPSSYMVNGSTLTFNEAPPNGTIIVVNGLGVKAMTTLAEANVVSKDAPTGSAILPSGSTAQRSLLGNSDVGIRYNTDLATMEVWNGAGWASLGGSVVPSIAELLTAKDTTVNVLNYHTGLEGGGGVFYWDATKAKSEHNGGTVIDPSKAFPSDWNSQTQLTTWFTAGSSGTGCWVRQYDGAVNVKWFGAKGDYNIITKTGTDDTVTFKNAFSLGVDVEIPSGYNFLISEYISIKSNTKVSINGNVISKEVVPNPYSTTLKLHTSGFDLNKVTNVTIQGNGTLLSEGFLDYTEDNFELHKNQGYTPFIAIRSCTNVDVKDINLYKVAMGISVNRCAEPYYTDWNLTNYDEFPINCNIYNVTIKCSSLFGITLNSARESSMHDNYCHTAGDSGLHIQFSHKCNVYNNKRFSRYGDGSDLGTGVALLAKNDSQGISIENSHSCNVYGNTVDGFIETGIDIKNNCTDINVFGNYVSNCQCMSITARGGDTVYGLNTSISIKDNYIERHGYLHTSGEAFINYSLRGAIFIDDTYSAVVENNTITGINDRGGQPIRCNGVNYNDLGFWSSKTTEQRVSYTSIIINNNTVNFQAYRSNYSNATGFESKDCNISGIKLTGIWGKIKIDGNSILGDGFADGRYSSYLSLAGIEVLLTQTEGANEVITRSCDISNNTVSYWNGGGIYLNLDNTFYDTPASVNVQNNTINNLPGYGMYLTNFNFSNISNNTIKRVGLVNTSVGYERAITLLNVYGALIDGNIVRNTNGLDAMFGYVNCLYSDASLIYEGSNHFELGTGDSTSYYTEVNGSIRQSSLNTTAITSTNAIGKAIRFGDGTMITTQTVASNAPNIASGGIYISNPLEVNFPISFIGIPVVSSNSAWMSSFQNSTSSSGFLYIYNPTSIGYGALTDITAIGRWKQ